MPNASRPAVAKASADIAAIARFLCALADRVERDSVFAAQIGALLTESGLLPNTANATPRQRASRARATTPRGADEPAVAAALDPFAVLRENGGDALHTRLDTLSAAQLHELIRAHRLDPARISARWGNQARLVELIVSQVRARADHGKAFARV